jgi:predicted aldo/keto reductase-like oxidoreductase
MKNMNSRRSGISRREFFLRAAGGAAAFGLKGLAGRTFAQALPKVPITRTLGNTGISLPLVNMGVMNASNPELVKRSYEIGVRHFDTAAGYQRGLNEIMVGKALRELGVRDRTVIGTKFLLGHDRRTRLSANEIRDAFLKSAEESLRRLQTDYIDIFHVHDVQDTAFLDNPGVREALASLKEQKKVRHLGFTMHNNSTNLLLHGAESGFYEVVTVGFNYAMSGSGDFIEALQKARAKGIGLIAMKTQCAQLWYREEMPAELWKFYDGRLMNTAMLKWVLRHDFITCAVPGYTTFAQMEEDFSVASDLEYTGEERRFLEDRNIRLAMTHLCLQCGCCLGSCPKGAAVPSLMRAHMYVAGYKNPAQAGAALRGVPGAHGLSACRSCDECAARCVRAVPIGRRVGELKQIFSA